MNKDLRKQLIPIVSLLVVAAVFYGAVRMQDSNPVERDTAAQGQLNYISYQGAEGENALDLLRANHNVETEDFGSMGQFVSKIDSVPALTNFFWAFYVNGKMADVSADKYITKQGDFIEWKLEEIK